MEKKKRVIMTACVIVIVTTSLIASLVYFRDFIPFSLVQSDTWWFKSGMNLSPSGSGYMEEVSETCSEQIIYLGAKIYIEDGATGTREQISGDYVCHIHYTVGGGRQNRPSTEWTCPGGIVGEGNFVTVELFIADAGTTWWTPGEWTWHLLGAWNTDFGVESLQSLDVWHMQYDITGVAVIGGYKYTLYYGDGQLGYAHTCIYSVGWYEIGPPQPPVASFTFSPESIYEGNTVTFDGTNSYDPDGGSIESFTWYFGDETSPVTFTYPTTTHLYSGGGTYQAKLIVTDDESITDSTIKPVTVKQIPVASFIVSNENPQEYESITFDATISSGTSLEYSWQFGDDNTGSGVVVYHSYTGVGLYTSQLAITDGTKSDSTSKTLNVAELPPEIQVLTNLVFASFTEVEIEVKVTKSGAPQTGITVAMDIKDAVGQWVIPRKEAMSGDDGVATFTITTPTSGTYYVTFLANNVPLVDTTMIVRPGLTITLINPSTTQTFDMGEGYDLILEGKLIHGETGVDISGYSCSVHQVIGPQGEIVSTDSPSISGAKFTMKARVYVYYKPDYAEKTVTILLKFEKADFSPVEFEIDIIMKPPQLYYLLEDTYHSPLKTVITVGTSEFYIVFYTPGVSDPFGDITGDNVDLSITDPNDVRYIGKTDFTVYWQDSVDRLYVSFPFDEVGYYEVAVTVSGLAIEVEGKTFTLEVREELALPWFVTDPMVIAGVVGVIFLFLIYRLLKGGRREEHR